MVMVILAIFVGGLIGALVGYVQGYQAGRAEREPTYDEEVHYREVDRACDLLGKALGWDGGRGYTVESLAGFVTGRLAKLEGKVRRLDDSDEVTSGK